MFLIYIDAIPVLQPRSYPLDLFYKDRNIYVHAEISSRQELAETLPATVHAVGTIGGELDKIWNVCVCFSGAYLVENNQVVPTLNQAPFAGEYLSVTHIRPSEISAMTFGQGAYLVGFDQTIEWLSPIESVPAIMVYYRNLTLTNGWLQQNSTSQSYPAKSLHIESYSTLEANKTNIKFYVVSVVGSALAIVQFLLSALSKREKPKLRKIT